MLEGWQISAIWAYQTGFAWAPNDQKNNDWGGTAESNAAAMAERSKEFLVRGVIHFDVLGIGAGFENA
jgi:hypothetical protein